MLSSFSAEEAVLLLLLWGGSFTALGFVRARHLPELLWQLGVVIGGAVLSAASLLLARRGGASFVGGSPVVMAVLVLVSANQAVLLVRA